MRRFFAQISTAGLIGYGRVPGSIGVLDAPRRTMRIGMASCPGWDGDGLAVSRLAVPGSATPDGRVSSPPGATGRDAFRPRDAGAANPSRGSRGLRVSWSFGPNPVGRRPDLPTTPHRRRPGRSSAGPEPCPGRPRPHRSGHLAAGARREALKAAGRVSVPRMPENLLNIAATNLLAWRRIESRADSL